ncbi:MAG: S8 family serine peptidase [Patescibacteria group bacterium]
MKKFFAIFAFSCLLSAFFVNGAKANQSDYPQNSLILKLKETYQAAALENLGNRGIFSLSSLDALNKNQGVIKIKPLSEKKTSSLYGSFQLNFDENKNIPELVATYEKNPYVKYAELNYILKINTFSPNDPYYSQQWNLAKINTALAWDYDATPPLYGGSSSIVVAVLDTGVAYENYGSFIRAPDLENTNFVAGYDFMENDKHPNDDDGHGTSIAEIIAASTDNDRAIAGIAFNISIMPVRVIKHDSTTTAAVVAQGIDYARENGADVINMSLGGETSSEILYTAIKDAVNAGLIIVASTGNDSNDRIYYPAAYPEVIAVGATKQTDEISAFSNYGAGLDLMAPGENILAEYCTNPPTCSRFRQASLNGTSQAAPHVTAAAALLLSSGLTAEKTEAALLNGAKDLGLAGYDTTFGYGLLDIEGAFALAENDINSPTTTLTTKPAEPDGDNGYFITYPRITLSATDNNGVAATYYRINSGSWKLYSQSFSLADGQHLIEYYSKDIISNNEMKKSAYIYVDTAAPSLQISLPFADQTVYASSLVSKGTMSDATSGVISLSIDDHAQETTAATFSEELILNKGINSLTYSVEDRAGHVTSITREVYSYPKNNILIGLGSGELPRVRGFNSENKLTGEFLAFAATFRGGLNVVAADINQDGAEEIVTGPKSSGGPQVRIFTGGGQLVSQFFAYATTFRGEVNIAAGDVDGDGKVEIIAGAGAGGGPHIRIFDYKGNLKEQFFAFAATFRGGVKVAADDVNGDGVSEIIAGAGAGGGPQVRIFEADGTVLSQFFAFAATFRGGVNLAASDIDNDGTAEIIAAPQSSGGPQVRVFDRDGNVKNQFMVYSNAFRGGLNLGSGDFNNDGINEIITSVSTGYIGPEVKIFGMAGNFIANFMAFSSSFRGGITVAGFN